MILIDLLHLHCIAEEMLLIYRYFIDIQFVKTLRLWVALPSILQWKYCYGRVLYEAISIHTDLFVKY